MRHPADVGSKSPGEDKWPASRMAGVNDLACVTSLGRYMVPEAYGKPASLGIDALRQSRGRAAAQQTALPQHGAVLASTATQ